LIVWRHNLKVYYRSVDPLEAALLKRMRNGAAFDEICAVAAETSDEQQALTTIHRLLERWLNEGLLAAF
jgi:hypothetical protein